MPERRTLRRIPLGRLLVGLRDYRAGDLTIGRAITSGTIEVTVDGFADFSWCRVVLEVPEVLRGPCRARRTPWRR